MRHPVDPPSGAAGAGSDLPRVRPGRRVRRPTPGWLGEGPERCPFCLQGYSVEVEVHCADCDLPGCPHCLVVVRERGVAVCPPCGSPEAAGEAEG